MSKGKRKKEKKVHGNKYAEFSKADKIRKKWEEEAAKRNRLPEPEPGPRILRYDPGGRVIEERDPNYNATFYRW